MLGLELSCLELFVSIETAELIDCYLIHVFWIAAVPLYGRSILLNQLSDFFLLSEISFSKGGSKVHSSIPVSWQRGELVNSNYLSKAENLL